MYFNTSYLLFVLPAVLLSIWAQARVSGTFTKYQAIANRSGMTGADVAKEILRLNGIYNVRIEQVAGNLTDHFDPKANVIRLSQTVYSSTSVSAIGVAAHETGHAIQYHNGYLPIKIRNAIVPVASIGSNLAMPLVMLGLIFVSGFLVEVGILLFCAVVLFQVVTLPVEFDASGRALKILQSQALLDDTELSGAKKVLRAAAMTYVAATFTALGNLLWLLSIAGGRGRRR